VHEYDWLRNTLIGIQESESERESGEGRMVDQRHLDQTSRAMILRDSDGTIRYWSAEAERMYGWKAEDVLGKRTHNVFDTKFPAPFASIEKQTKEKSSWMAS